MSEPRISVCILARDEEQELPGCLETVDWADERVVVVDSRSRDGSDKIARDRAEIVDVEVYRGDIEQRNHALGLASGDWVLFLDPDERLPVTTAEELRKAVASADPGVAAFEINRATHHLGRWIRHGDFFPDWKRRLFRRELGSWQGTNPHGRVVVRGSVARLRGEFEHRSYRDLADQLERIQRFSSEAARALHEQGRRVRTRDLLFRPPARFLRAYLLKLGFLDGVPGLVIAVATAFHVFLKYAKLWELERVRASGPPRSPSRPSSRSSPR